MIHKDKVSLVEKESVDFFRRALKSKEGIGFMSLRGRIGQAPIHIRTHINDNYPGAEFLFFLEDNKDVFEIDSNRNVFLIR